jgi:hypothetical protein
MDKIMSVEESQSLRTIKPIDVTTTQLEILKHKLKSSKISPAAKEKIQKESGFGMCCCCGGIATQTASYDCAGATRIERYCNPCVEKTFSHTQKLQISNT